MKSSCLGSSEWPFAVPFQFYESMSVYRDATQCCRLTDICMFSFDVSFDKTQRFISVRADSVYMCVEI